MAFKIHNKENKHPNFSTTKMNYPKLFDYMYDVHGVNLLESEMVEVINICSDIINNKNKPNCDCDKDTFCNRCYKQKDWVKVNGKFFKVDI